MKNRQHLGVLGLGFVEFQIIFLLSIWLAFPQQAAGLRPIREKARTWSDEVCVCLSLMIARKFLPFDDSQKKV